MNSTAAPAREVRTIDGCAVSYLRMGRGPTVLYLHGAAGVRGDEPWLARLAEHAELIVPDHPGFGRSELPGWLGDVHDLGYFYLDFIAALGLRDVHLVGHSLGGWIACELAVRSAAALRSLTLVAPAGLRLKGFRKLDTFLLSPAERARHAFADPALAQQAIEAPVSDEQLETDLKNRYAFALLAWNPRLYDPSLAKWLHRIDVPTLILWGDGDRIIPPAYAAEFARLIPAARTELLSGCGHVPQRECTDAFVAQVVRQIATGGGLG